MEAYAEISSLELDLRNLAEPSLKRLRQPPLVSRLLDLINPLGGWGWGLTSKPPGGGSGNGAGRGKEGGDGEKSDGLFSSWRWGASRESSSTGTGTGVAVAGVGGTRTTSKASRRRKGREMAVAAASDNLTSMNRTIANLRQNLTAMTKALRAKDTIIHELQEQALGYDKEADKR